MEAELQLGAALGLNTAAFPLHVVGIADAEGNADRWLTAERSSDRSLVRNTPPGFYPNTAGFLGTEIAVKGPPTDFPLPTERSCDVRVLAEQGRLPGCSPAGGLFAEETECC